MPGVIPVALLAFDFFFGKSRTEESDIADQMDSLKGNIKTDAGRMDITFQHYNDGKVFLSTKNHSLDKFHRFALRISDQNPAKAATVLRATGQAPSVGLKNRVTPLLKENYPIGDGIFQLHSDETRTTETNPIKDSVHIDPQARTITMTHYAAASYMPTIKECQDEKSPYHGQIMNHQLGNFVMEATFDFKRDEVRYSVRPAGEMV